MRRFAPLLVLVALAAPAAAQAATEHVSDFELSAPALRAAAGRAVVSEPIRAPRPFDLVGLRWRSGAPPAVRLRVRRGGGPWSHWVRVASSGDHGPDPGTREHTRGGGSDPLWAGGSRWVQYRLSHAVGGLRLHFVRATVKAPAQLHSAAAGQPPIRSRKSWDPGHDCKPRAKPYTGQVNVAFVHHTDTATSYSRSDVPAMILSICRFHRNSRGWNDIGYNFLVDRFGTLWEGRMGGIDKAIVGAQAQGFNSQSTGIANLGTFVSTQQTGAALDAMARLIRWKLPLHGSPTYGKTTLTSAGGETNRWKAGRAVEFDRISGHRDADSTDCPGDALYAQLPDLRNRVGHYDPAPAGPAPSIALTRPPARIAPGRLLPAEGTIDPAKAFVTLVLDRKVKHRWHAYRRISLPASDGSFSKKARLRRPGLYRVFVRFGGDGANGAGRSKLYKVRVPRRA